MTDIDNFEKVSYTALEGDTTLTWYEYFFGKSEPEIEADPQSKDAKYKVTQQIKNSINHKLIQKHQDDTPFPHTQSVVKTEDKSNDLPSPYQPPTLVPTTILSTMQTKPQIPRKLHPSIQQLRKRKKLIKDDMDI